MIAIVVAAVGGLFAVLNHTRLGMRIRAGTRDLDTVSTLGVNIRVLRSLNFGIGIYIAGLAGVLAAGLLGLSPTIGASLLMPSFVAIIVGGLGSLLGTLLGGLLIGVASGLAAVYFPSATEAVDLRDDGTCAAGPPPRPPRRRGEAALRSGERTLNGLRSHALDVTVGALLLFMPFWLASDRRLYGTRHPNRRHGAGGDVAQFPPRIHGRPVLWPRGLLRTRRLRRRDGDQISRRRYDPRHGPRHAGRDARGHGHRRADRQAPGRLFRHGDDRLRSGVLFSRLPLEFADRRRRWAHRLAPYADRFRLRQAGHLRQRQGVLLLRAGRLRRLRRGDGDAARVSLRTHADRDPRERAARAAFLGSRSSSISGCLS